MGHIVSTDAVVSGEKPDGSYLGKRMSTFLGRYEENAGNYYQADA